MISVKNNSSIPFAFADGVVFLLFYLGIANYLSKKYEFSVDNII